MATLTLQYILQLPVAVGLHYVYSTENSTGADTLHLGKGGVVKCSALTSLDFSRWKGGGGAYSPPPPPPPAYSPPASSPPPWLTPPQLTPPQLTPPGLLPPRLTPPAYSPPGLLPPAYSPPAYSPPPDPGLYYEFTSHHTHSEQNITW